MATKPKEPKPFDIGALKPFYADDLPDESKLANVGLRLPESRKFTTREQRRLTKVLNRTRAATSTIGQLPQPGESLHCVLNGSFALFDFIPAILELSGQPIDELAIATLGFSKANVSALGELAEAGQLERVSLLCSHYFSAADAAIYSQAVELCQRRGWRIAAMRTHAKLLLIRTGKHRLVVESSANLRSCHNVEQASIFNDAGLFDFHQSWIQELLNKGADNGT